MGSLANRTWQKEDLKAQDMLIETSRTENPKEKKRLEKVDYGKTKTGL